jgi:hypothetical protein
MRRIIRSAAVSVGLVVAMAGGLAPAAHAAPAFYGRETYKIVNVKPSSKPPVVTAWGAFKATGTYVRKYAALVFPKGRIIVSRHVTSTTFSRPDLSTCRFTIWQKGTFRVTRATGKYRGLRESGHFHSTIHGRYNQTGTNECGSTLVAYHVVTYEVGFVR